MQDDAPLVGPGRPVLGYQPALDGLRGLALVAIFIYHSALDAAPGAFLSVSTFFTLSGFLITTILLAEHDGAGAISLRSFWSRRLRRLMPAALAAVAIITIAGAVLGDSTQRVRLRTDGLASLFYVANWRFIAAGDAYGASFESPSPFTHFWTLAIEEQLYVVLPLVVVGALLIGKGSRRAVTGALLALGGVSILWANWLVSDGASLNRLYFGTDIRATELITGALAAVWWSRRSEPISARTGRALTVAGPLALGAMVVLWAVADLSQRWFYRGGLTLYTMLTITVILSSIQPAGIVRRVLSLRPLTWIGVVSYGAYLVHFPVLIWLDQHTRWPALVQVAVAAPITGVVAAVSARWLERPIRTGQRIRSERALALTTGAVATVLAVVLITTAAMPAVDRADLDAALRWQRFMEQSAAQDRSDAPRLALFGDSTALMTGRGLSEVSREQPDEFVAGAGWANLGCGLLDRGVRRSKGAVAPVPDDCRDWEQEWRNASAARPSDLAVIQVGPWEVTDQALDPDQPLRSLEDPVLADELAARLRVGITTLLESNTYVVVISPPDIEMGRIDGRSPRDRLPESDPARMARFRQILDSVTAEFDRVSIVRLDDWLAARSDDRSLRPDGVHFTDRSAITAAEWLGPELVTRYREVSGRTTSGVIRR